MTKYFIAIIIAGILIINFKTVSPFLDLFPYQLTKEYKLFGYFNNYCIKGRYSEKPLVSEMKRNSEWMIDSNYIYGHRGNRFNLVNDYFAINRKNNSTIFFEDLSDLNNYLRDKNLKPFNMTDCESVLHLRINKRKYKP